MDESKVLQALEAVKAGTLSPEDALKTVSGAAPDALHYAVVDQDRNRRCGFPEVILAEGKSPEQVAGIAEKIWKHGDRLLCTRASQTVFEAVRERVPKVQYSEVARLVYGRRTKPLPGTGLVCIVTAGTADIPVAEEARITATLLDARVETTYDVGVAGIHRVLDRTDMLRKARVLIVVAGMEGALPSVVGGLVDRPVVAVPTSIGYGSSFSGLSALLGMLNSCASNVCVVNIDNGFGAGYVAALINKDPDS